MNHTLRQPSCVSLMLIAFIAATTSMLGGCTTTDSIGPTVVQLEADQYQRAFAAATEVARDAGYVASLRDPRRGIIETEARISGTLMDAWTADHQDAASVAENTVHLQRRRIRLEFQIADTVPDDLPDTSSGADILATTGPWHDLTTLDRPLELRAWVYVERANVHGLRRNAWSRRLTRRTTTIDPATGDPVRRESWVPLARDEAMEGRILAAIEQELVSN